MIYYKRISQVTGRKLVLLHLFAKLIQPGNRCFIFEERYMNSVKRLLLSLTKFEWFLWIASSLVIGVSYIASPNRDVLTIIDSLIGVAALIFIAKGYVFGQILAVVFAVLYGIIAFFCRYYGEMITYLCMTAPIAVLTAIAWIKHPYKDSNEVEVSRVSKGQILVMSALTVAVTVVFYFILSALGNENLFVSTFSVTTSFVACYLSLLRSPYYAIAYVVNDLVLVVLWSLAARADIAYLPMVFCFLMFFINDIYGFVNWLKIQRAQQLGV